MLESLKEWFASLPLDTFSENLNNDRLVEIITSPTGMGISLAVIALAMFLKWRITFVVFSGILAGIFVVRYTITDTGAPSKSILLFVGAAIAVAAFVIYFTLVKDD